MFAVYTHADYPSCEHIQTARRAKCRTSKNWRFGNDSVTNSDVFDVVHCVFSYIFLYNGVSCVAKYCIDGGFAKQKNLADRAKPSLYQAANSILGKSEKRSEKITLQLTSNICIFAYITLHGLEACPHNKVQLASIILPINWNQNCSWNCLVFNTSNTETAKTCQEHFSFELSSIHTSNG